MCGCPQFNAGSSARSSSKQGTLYHEESHSYAQEDYYQRKVVQPLREDLRKQRAAFEKRKQEWRSLGNQCIKDTDEAYRLMASHSPKFSEEYASRYKKRADYYSRN